MNRRGFIASMFALPAAIKALVADFKPPVPKSPIAGHPVGRRFNCSANDDIAVGDLVYLKNGKLTKISCDPANVLGVAVDKPEGGTVKYIMNHTLSKRRMIS